MGKVVKFGANPDVTNAADEDVWIPGGTYVFPTAAAETSIVSSDAADDAAGTGARTARVEGIIQTSGGYLEVIEEATLDGTTPVVLTTEFYRINRARALTVGSGGVNAGDIDVLHGATVLARIGAGYGQTLQAIYTVPGFNNDGMWLTSWRVGMSRAAGSVEASLLIRQPGESWGVLDVDSAAPGSPGGQEFGPDTYRADPGTDIKIHVDFCTNNNTRVNAGFKLNT